MKLQIVWYILIPISVLCVNDASVISSHNLKDQMELAALSNDGKLWVINVLPKSVHKDCTIPGSLHIPLHALSKKVKNWPRDRSIVVYCAHRQCPLAWYAYQELIKLGFDHVQLFLGGLQEWKNQQFPIAGSCKAGYLKN